MGELGRTPLVGDVEGCRLSRCQALCFLEALGNIDVLEAGDEPPQRLAEGIRRKQVWVDPECDPQCD